MAPSRREFLKTSFLSSCALLAGAGALTTLPSCSKIPVFKTEPVAGKITVPLSAFAESNMRIVRAQSLPNDVLVVKNSDTEYTALLMKCTHQDFQLNANPGGLNCPLHGSAFDLKGHVTNGPATQPLKRFRTIIENDQLLIS